MKKKRLRIIALALVVFLNLNIVSNTFSYGEKEEDTIIKTHSIGESDDEIEKDLVEEIEETEETEEIEDEKTDREEIDENLEEDNNTLENGDKLEENKVDEEIDKQIVENNNLINSISMDTLLDKNIIVSGNPDIVKKEDEDKLILIVDNKTVTVSSKDGKVINDLKIIVKNNGHLIIDNLIIDNNFNDKNDGFSPIFIEDNTENIVEVRGDNKLIPNVRGSGIAVNNKGNLSEKSADTNVNIIGDGNLEINSGFIKRKPSPTYDGASIGGENRFACGNLAIKDSVNLKILNYGNGASIGGGNNQGSNDNGNIIITDNVKFENIYSGKDVKKYGRIGSAVIGNGHKTQAGSGNITISKNAEIKIGVYSLNASAIGNSQGGRLDPINIMDNANILISKDAEYTGEANNNRGYTNIYRGDTGAAIGHHSQSYEASRVRDLVNISGNPKLKLYGSSGGIRVNSGNINISGGDMDIISAGGGIVGFRDCDLNIENAKIDIQSYRYITKEELEFNGVSGDGEEISGRSPGIGGLAGFGEVDIDININNSDIKTRANKGGGIGTRYVSVGKYLINIKNSKIQAESILGAGIGPGVFDECSEFKINILDNSEILATSDRGAGIGGGYNDRQPIEINIDNAKKIEANSRRGAAIGNGEDSIQSANIRITNTEEVYANSSQRGAGIGTGMYHNRKRDEDTEGNADGKIYIDNIGKLKISTYQGSGIGTGSTSKENMDIEIKNTNLDINSYHGSGIGTGDDAMNQVDTNPYINIKLENIKGKVESINGAAIGTGYASKSEKPFDLNIKNSDLEVESFWGAGIGGGRMYIVEREDEKNEILDTNSGNILIEGGKLEARSGLGSGIGGGGCLDPEGYEDEYKSIFHEGKLKITGDADILASSIGVETYKDKELVLRDAITAKLEDSERFMGSHTFTNDTSDKYPYNIKVRCEKGLVIKDFTLKETFEDSKRYPKSYSYSTNNQCTSYTEELYYQCGEKEFFGQIVQTEPFREKGRHPENIKQFNSDVNYCGSCPIVICDNTFVTFNAEEITGKYSVTFDANGGEFEDTTLIKIYKVQKNNKIGKPETPIKKDKVFDKWTLDREGKEEFNFEDIIKEDITLYAKWKEKGEEIVFTFDANGGKFEDNQSTKEFKIKAGENINPISSPNREGYKFEFWAKTADCNEEFDFKNKITENTTVYGNWSKKPSRPDGDKDKPDIPVKPERPDDKPTTNIVDTVILSNGDKYTDVLTATVLGNELKAPILLTGTRCVIPKVTREIKRLNPKKIIIVGGEDSVTDVIYKKMENLEFEVERISGRDRYATAREIASRVRSISGVKDKAILVDGTNFPDVITISTYASLNHAPILLTEPESLNSVTKKALSDFNISNITIGGGEVSVSENIEKFLKADYKVNRIGGYDRYETASLIAKEVRNQTKNKEDLILVDGTNFPDGITINSLAGKYSSPIHLTNPNTLEDITKKDIKDFNIKNIIIGGGVASVSANIESYLKGENINTSRISGRDRYETSVKISEKFTEK